MRKRSHGPEKRRGATLVLVAVMIILLGGMAAFAIDLARVYGGVNELQTGADAAALAGAHRLQRIPATSAAAGIITFGAQNKAFGSAITLANGDVEGGFWDPSNGSFTAQAWTLASTNAVRVTARRQTNLGFGGLLGVSSITPFRRGVAWIANQATLDCIKPWGMPLTYVNTLLGQSLTTQAGVNALRNLGRTLAGQQQLTIVAGPNINNPRGSPNTPPTTFLALTGANSSRKEYQNAIIDLNCEGTADYSVSGGESQIQTQPGQGNGDIPRTTVQAVELNLPGNQGNGGRQTCRAQIGNDATCYDPATNAAGVDLTVAAVTQTAVNSADINVLMGFKLMCVFRGSNQPGSSSNSETCPWLTAAGLTANNYTQGTLVGYPTATEKPGPAPVTRSATHSAPHRS